MILYSAFSWPSPTCSWFREFSYSCRLIYRIFFLLINVVVIVMSSVSLCFAQKLDIHLYHTYLCMYLYNKVYLILSGWPSARLQTPIQRSAYLPHVWVEATIVIAAVAAGAAETPIVAIVVDARMFCVCIVLRREITDTYINVFACACVYECTYHT